MLEWDKKEVVEKANGGESSEGEDWVPPVLDGEEQPGGGLLGSI